ncbi:hypothetical protein L6R52_15260, partial [Myxococcota bacterium]|nr:hypothetical protein [Myxococcota bacterium]
MQPSNETERDATRPRTPRGDAAVIAADHTQLGELVDVAHALGGLAGLPVITPRVAPTTTAEAAPLDDQATVLPPSAPRGADRTIPRQRALPIATSARTPAIEGHDASGDRPKIPAASTIEDERTFEPASRPFLALTEDDELTVTPGVTSDDDDVRTVAAYEELPLPL